LAHTIEHVVCSVGEKPAAWGQAVQRIVTCTGWTRHEGQYQRQKIIVGYSITSRFRHFTEQLVGKGKGLGCVLTLGHGGAQGKARCRRSTCRSAARRPSTRRKRSDGGLWFGDDAEPEVATAQHSNVMVQSLWSVKSWLSWAAPPRCGARQQTEGRRHRAGSREATRRGKRAGRRRLQGR
jgi:hypothetical protein